MGLSASTWGDPHISTYDGLAVDNQKKGRFTLAKSASGDLTVQADQVDGTSLGYPGTTVNRTLYVKLGATTLKYDAAADAFIVNGKKVPVPADGATVKLPGGVSVSRSGSNLTITGPKGDQITITDNGSYLDAYLSISSKRPAGSVRGALGTNDADDDSSNDMVGRNGQVMTDSNAFFDAWRTLPGELLP